MEINGGEARTYLYHCFFCGGKAPAPKRELLFAVISEAERLRLRELTNPLKTLDDVLSVLGDPEQDYENGVAIMLPETESSSPKEQSF